LTLLLIRHAACDHVGRRLAGRAPGVRLNAQGRRQAQALAGALTALAVEAVYSGPLERARETAAILADGLGRPLEPANGLDELDYGDWTGRTLESLTDDPVWRAFNGSRSTTRIPGGETMGEVVARARVEVERLRRAHPDGMVAAVSHGDVIRGLVLDALGVSLDHIHRLEVAPASVTVLRMFDEFCHVLAVGWTTEGPIPPA
jgi:probable phosphoglycerate mutase